MYSSALKQSLASSKTLGGSIVNIDYILTMWPLASDCLDSYAGSIAC